MDEPQIIRLKQYCEAQRDLTCVSKIKVKQCSMLHFCISQNYLSDKYNFLSLVTWSRKNVKVLADENSIGNKF